MSQIPGLKTWADDEILTAPDLNSTLAAIKDTMNTFGVFRDVAATITAAMVWSARQNFQAGADFGASITIATGGLTVAGGLNLTGALAIVGSISATNGLAVTGGGAGVTGPMIVTGPTQLGSTLSVAGALSVLSITGLAGAALSIPVAASVTGALTATTVRAVRATRSVNGAVVVDFSTKQHEALTLTGTVSSLTLSGAIAGQIVSLELIQDATGTRTITAWDAAVVFTNGLTPSLTSTPSRKDIVSFLYDGVKYCQLGFAPNLASTA